MWSKVGSLMVMMMFQLTNIPDVRSRLIEATDGFDDIGSSVDGKEDLQKTVEAMKKVMGAMGRQVLLQQLFVEERIRSEGHSGVKQKRVNTHGTRNYHTDTHSGGSVNAIHDHSNNIRTVGMGEIIAVLNGVEFRTRHNDYRLYRPHSTSKEWHATEDVPFPDVPPEVLSKNNVTAQIEEMRAWFKAWKDQDFKTRDYRKYFKPILCYLEGAWTTATPDGEIDEPFESDRHFVDASSWFDLQEKIRFTSYSGRKDNLENYSYLPTTIMKVSEDGYPEFAQWNYRIMCHPLSRDLPLNRFRVVDELGLQLTSKKTSEEHSRSRAARFQINPFDTDTWTDRKNSAKWGLLDTLMSEIPGKDNYAGNLKDEAFNLMAYSVDPKRSGKELRADRYHRSYKVAVKGAMGASTRKRGFSDEQLFMAMNTQSKVAGLDLTSCKGGGKKKVCETINQKWSYAIPLEIIYLTPLNKWNPYDIHYKGDASSDLGKTVEDWTGKRRNGGLTEDKAYDGTHSRKYYMTPVEFFSGNEVGSGAADTTRNTVGVLDRQGNVRKCKATGTRIFFPEIAGVGTLRQRYPIVPVHGEGSSAWKELEATKDLLLSSKTNGYIFREPLQSGPLPTEPAQKPAEFEVQTAKSNKIGPHEHLFSLDSDQMDILMKGKPVAITTDERAGHTHDLKVKWNKAKNEYYIVMCDGKRIKWKEQIACRDEHPKILARLENE